MAASQHEQDMLCRIFGKRLSGEPLDREVGDLIANGRGPLTQKLFTYVRYNADLTREGLTALGLGKVDPATVQQLDSTKGIEDLRRIGRAVAKKYVRDSHFDGFI